MDKEEKAPAVEHQAEYIKPASAMLIFK